MEKLTAKEFNLKYKINGELQNKLNFVPESKKQNLMSIAGKPKRLIVEIFKRFFSNPVVVIAFTIFIALLLCSILIPSRLIAKYSPTQEISGLDGIKLLPPSYAPLIKNQATDSSSSFYTLWTDIKEFKSENIKYFDFFLKTVKINGIAQSNPLEFDPPSDFVVTYDAYAFYKALALRSDLWNIKQTIIPEHVVNSALSKIDDLKPLLGTNHLGQDIWTTTWYATWRAIKIALAAATLQTIIGVSIGAYLGFHAGKKIDTIIMRIIDIFLSLPELIWLLLFTTIFGATHFALIAALVITGWAGPVSSTRMFIITIKDEEYITAAKSIGATTRRQIFVHALPAVLGKIATNFVRRIPSIIMSVASLAFLGFFKEKNDVNLGQLLIESIPYTQYNPWTLALPSIILLTLSLSLHFIAMGVHDALDPKVIAKAKRK
ncbi:peptide ABC transporter permease [Metamycoplasma hyosynoviae]|uniref:ABC transporter permease n=1 Tax=Metamycoplasma hyosynoviae TaxID=29559 RepID=UPI0004611B4C|nr:ABC transporter permease [Metamycoplasma hyosynoviae]KDE42082.1 peptide ABC transporter permease [Metamycoplasma hyosynoviae]KDE42218.1 peptide ABC transporter permease [Metamycoplasma hyosynoviae]KDE43895.1 peptide ABC transporter permease [Metamycoplasma hyosynoviae]KDE45013.1 peptide ABC transporter permease [Metamycoplasma hyosynoviae]KDE45484.1 peptide ABC transporter permease [Metamycoplasma hyosynoviae]